MKYQSRSEFYRHVGRSEETNINKANALLDCLKYKLAVAESKLNELYMIHSDSERRWNEFDKSVRVINTEERHNGYYRTDKKDGGLDKVKDRTVPARYVILNNAYNQKKYDVYDNKSVKYAGKYLNYDQAKELLSIKQCN